MVSAAGTPQLEPSNPYTYVPPSPSPLGANPPLTPMDEIPPLSLEVLEDRNDKVDGLRLVADSIAQMRQRASTTLVFHPICVAGLSAALAVAYRLGLVSMNEPGIAVTLSCGVIMSYLMAIRYLASGYVNLAEQLRWSWLQSDDGDEDMVLAARYNNEIIASLVLRLEPNPALLSRKKHKSMCLKGGRGVIRAWTTRLKYRGKGIGRDLLFEAVRITKERCGKDAEVGFAKEHANSAMLLPNVFNGTFKKDEVRATKALEEAVADWEVLKKKR